MFFHIFINKKKRTTKFNSTIFLLPSLNETHDINLRAFKKTLKNPDFDINHLHTKYNYSLYYLSIGEIQNNTNFVFNTKFINTT